MSSLKEKLQHKYALSEQGAKDMLKGICFRHMFRIIVSDASRYGMLYLLVKQYLWNIRWKEEACCLALWAVVLCLAADRR